MTPAALIGTIASGGTAEIWGALPRALGWTGAIALALGAAYTAATWLLRRRSRVTHLVFLPPAVPCPCCTGPGWSADCTCREDCGEAWCQAADPEPPECPWCDTRECIDRDLCNCAGPCGSWLCVVKEESRG